MLIFISYFFGIQSEQQRFYIKQNFFQQSTEKWALYDLKRFFKKCKQKFQSKKEEKNKIMEKYISVTFGHKEAFFKGFLYGKNI